MIMAKNYFIANNSNDLAKVQEEIIKWFKEKQYEIGSTTLDGKYFIQAKKTGTIRTLLGANLAFKVSIYWSQDKTVEREFIVETSIGKWITNIAGAGFTSIFMGGIPLLTGIANAGWALILEADLVSYISTTLNLQKVTKTENPNQVWSDQSVVVDVPYNSVSSYSARQKAEQKVQQDLQRIQEARQQGLISEQEFQNRKENLDDQIDEYEADFLIEEKIAKLQKAFAEGILDTMEFEEKVKEVHETTTEEILNKRRKERKAAKIAQLKEALNNGILTQEEYRQKIAQL